FAEWERVFGRKPGDIDVQLMNVTTEQAEAAARSLVRYIRANSTDKPWVDPKRKTLVMNTSRTTGKPKHAIDLHFPGEPSLDVVAEGAVVSPLSRMLVYGMLKEKPPLQVELPGIGTVSLARLSETGVGKVGEVLGWRRDPKTGKVILSPAQHRVPKDYVDLYEIIKTYSGKVAADNWATEMGITESIERNWKDTWRVGGGVHYRICKPLLLKMGISYDSNPVSETDRLPDIPVDRQWRYAAGVDYDLNKDMVISLNWEFIDLGKAPINHQIRPGGRRLSGDYDQFANIVSLSFRWKF
ncbi:hypothetical protein LCGC14_1863360, partial [marine sediment metagenome]